ncbi:MAG: ring-cleaving dioxygenase [Bacteroidota bacterium]
MKFPIQGIHHVTATVNDAQEDLDFYIKCLGLRLVKKTVNFDNHSVYHFYYGNEVGNPSTIMTTFPYKDQNVRVGTKGTGQSVATSFSVPRGSYGFWKSHLKVHDVTIHYDETRMGDWVLGFDDPSGLRLELIGADDTREPWHQGAIDAAYAIRGIHSVTLMLKDAGPTRELMEQHLDFQFKVSDGNRIRLEAASGGVGKYVDLLIEPDGTRGKNGIGTVHHVALEIGSEDIHKELREFLVSRNFRVTEIKDRKYFRSIYFREPGGVLFEVATSAPGFDVDEPLESLGRALKLPLDVEENRAEIEEMLPEVLY